MTNLKLKDIISKLVTKMEEDVIIINDAAMLPVGTMLRGTYRIDSYLSSGGFGNTYVATHIDFNETYAIKEFFIALGRGELLTRMRVDKLFPYILYLFMLGCISIWMSYKAEQTMLKVQQNNRTIRTLKIYNAQKTYEIVGLDRIATVEEMLKNAGSDVKAPEKPADVLR